MEEFLLWSLIGSIGVTLTFNLLSITFPKISARLQFHLIEAISPQQDGTPDKDVSLLKFISPFQALLILLLVLTIFGNIGTLLVL
jgi:hypothetical protein